MPALEPQTGVEQTGKALRRTRPDKPMTISPLSVPTPHSLRTDCISPSVSNRRRLSGQGIARSTAATCVCLYSISTEWNTQNLRYRAVSCVSRAPFGVCNTLAYHWRAINFLSAARCQGRTVEGGLVQLCTHLVSSLLFGYPLSAVPATDNWAVSVSLLEHGRRFRSYSRRILWRAMSRRRERLP
jgi:hypothetical protein